MMNGSLTESAVLAEGLVKSYGKVKALGGVSLDVRHGETFGIIGPDGAGKSTLFRLLTSLWYRTADRLRSKDSTP